MLSCNFDDPPASPYAYSTSSVLRYRLGISMTIICRTFTERIVIDCIFMLKQGEYPYKNDGINVTNLAIHVLTKIF